jgi:DNA-directed RNA polymerase specialized sigma subunit
MDNQQKKRYLMQYLETKEELMQLQEQYNELRSSLESAKAQRISDMPKSQRTFDKIGNGICQLDEFYNKHADLVDKWINIQKSISKLENNKERELMRLKYIKGYRMENIAVEMDCTWRHTNRIHSNALTNIKL